MRHRPRRVALGVVALVGITRFASAERARPSILLRSSDPSCPAESELVARVEQRLLPASVVDPNDRFELEVERSAEVTNARLIVTRADGTRATRTLEGASCDDLFDSVAFIAAMTIDPETASRSAPEPLGHFALRDQPPTASGAAVAEPPVPPVVERASAVTRTDHGPTAPSPARRAARPLSIELGVVVEGTTAVAPYLAAVGRLFATMRWQLEHVEPSVRLSVARSLVNDVSVDAERGATFQYTASRAEGCLGPRLEDPRVSVEACTAVDVGALEAEGYGVHPQHDETRVWFAPAALGRFGYSTGRLGLVTEGGLVVPVTRYRYELHEPDVVVFRPPAVALTVGAGLALRLP